MTGLLKLAAVLVLTTTAPASAAYAADLGGGMKDTPAAYTPDNVGVNWSGIYLGVHGGYGNANHELSVDESFEGKSFNIIDLDGINSRGFVGGIDGGFDVARNGWLFGLLGGYSASNMESSLSLFDGEAKWTLSKQGEWYLGGRLGRVVAPSTLLYLLAAYTHTQYELGGTGIDDKPSQSYSGAKLGTGTEYALGTATFVGLEYTHDFYGKQDWLNERGLKISDNLNEDKIQATFKIKFGGGLPYLGD